MTRLVTLRAARVIDAAVDRLAGTDGDVRGDEMARRAFLRLGTMSMAASLLAACNSQGPQSAAKVLAYAERKNETVERWLLRHTAMDHGRGMIAGPSFPSYFVSKHLPVWDASTRGPWMLRIGGLVERPVSLTFDQMVALPRYSQRVDHFCVEGWNAVAAWTGVRFTDLMQLVRPLPAAQYVDFRSFDDGYHESWDLESASHPQTLLAYAKDGSFLPAAYGAPARIHSPIKLGYKNTKYVTEIAFLAARNGGYWSDIGYEWYGGT